MIANQSRASAIFLFAVAALAGLHMLGANAFSPAGQTTGPAKSAQDKQDVDDKTILALIKQLGDDSFDKRDSADKKLAEIGDRALALLEKAAKDDPDAEVRLRAEQLVRGITSVLFKQVGLFKGHGGAGKPWVTRVAVTPDGKQAVSCGADGLRLWDLKAGNEILVFGQPKGVTYCWSLGISPDGKRLIVGGDNSKARIFDLQTGKQLRELVGHTKAIWGVALLADGKRAVTGAWDQSIRVWDVDTGKESRTFQGVRDNCRCLAVSPDGKLVAAGHFAVNNGPATLRIWDLETGTQIRECEGHTMEITSVAFSPDGKTIVTSSYDKSVRLWDTASGQQSQVAGWPHQSRGKRGLHVGRQTRRELRRCQRPDAAHLGHGVGQATPGVGRAGWWVSLRRRAARREPVCNGWQGQCRAAVALDAVKPPIRSNAANLQLQSRLNRIAAGGRCVALQTPTHLPERILSAAGSSVRHAIIAQMLWQLGVIATV